jgi:hypothetical protein
MDWLFCAFSLASFRVGQLFCANVCPDVKVSRHGLQVSFLWLWLPVGWRDIIDIKTRHVGVARRRKEWIVHPRALTVFHRLYGLAFSFTWQPSFVVGPQMDRHEELIKVIRRRGLPPTAAIETNP